VSRHLLVDLLEELEPLAGPVPAVQRADDLPGGGVQGCDKVVIPLRTWSWLRRSGRPCITGSTGWGSGT
jgi:hypothetical protein